MGDRRRYDATPNRREKFSRLIAAAGVFVNAARLVWEIVRHLT